MRRFEKIPVLDRLAGRRLAHDDPAPPAGADDGDRGQVEPAYVRLYERLTRHAAGI
jgi:hypothetical protein